jgi:phage gp29-like protein
MNLVQKLLSLAAKPTQPSNTGLKNKGNYIPGIVPKSISKTRSDVATWIKAQALATNADTPKRTQLLLLLNDVATDALLTSQTENRKLSTLGSSYAITTADGNTENEEITLLLKSAKWFNKIMGYALDSCYYGNSIVELTNDGININATLVPRQNIEPTKGRFYPDYSNDTYIEYRKAKEYGTWILEFDNEDFGLFNKAVPHVLFKRFAQSCWSELCEIYGIPPRVLKTNTTDPAMLDRSEQMMKDMGSAAWFIIDETETFEFAQGVATNGDVYAKLIQHCNNEISMLITGAIIGQDTEHGNRSKEDTSISILDKLVTADKMQLEQYANNIILPALANIGIIPPGLKLEFKQQEDKEALWEKAVAAMPYFEVNPDWINKTFGLELAAKAVETTPAPGANPKGKDAEKLAAGIDTDFFD